MIGFDLQEMRKEKIDLNLNLAAKLPLSELNKEYQTGKIKFSFKIQNFFNNIQW